MKTDTCTKLDPFFTSGNIYINVFCGVSKSLYLAHFTDNTCNNKNVYEKIKTEKCIPNTYNSYYTYFSNNITHAIVLQNCLDSTCSSGCQETIFGNLLF
jgi:hypothetical protein